MRTYRAYLCDDNDKTGEGSGNQRRLGEFQEYETERNFVSRNPARCLPSFTSMKLGPLNAQMVQGTE